MIRGATLAAVLAIHAIYTHHVADRRLRVARKHALKPRCPTIELDMERKMRRLYGLKFDLDRPGRALGAVARQVAEQMSARAFDPCANRAKERG